jgi:hypothetical protein
VIGTDRVNAVEGQMLTPRRRNRSSPPAHMAGLHEQSTRPKLAGSWVNMARIDSDG